MILPGEGRERAGLSLGELQHLQVEGKESQQESASVETNVW